MNLRQMEIFRAVMLAGTITGAAKSLNLSQPSVTEMLRRTEEKLRYPLFARIKGRLVPTPEAQILFGEAQAIFERVSSLNHSSELLRDAQLGAVSIVTTSALGLYILPRVLGDFITARTEVKSRLIIRRHFDLIDSILSEANGIGLAFFHDNDPRIARRELLRAPLVCICPGGHPLADRDEIRIGDLIRFPLITYASSTGLAPVANGMFAEAGITFRSVAAVTDIAQAWALVQAGVGVAVVDPFSHLGDLFPGVVVRPMASGVQATLNALVAPHRPISRAADAFIGHFQEALRARLERSR